MNDELFISLLCDMYFPIAIPGWDITYFDKQNSIGYLI